MGLRQIIGGLDAIDSTGVQAVQAARLGFLEWALTLSDGALPHMAARADLVRAKTARAHSAAARQFLAYLEDAAEAPRANPTRRGGRKRVLN